MQFIKPTTSLNRHVFGFLNIVGNGPTPYPVLPDGTQAIFFSDSHCFIGGLQTKATELYLPSAGRYFGIWFLPGGASQFFKSPPRDWKDSYLSYSDIKEPDLSPLWQAVVNETNFELQAALCNQWLLNRQTGKPNRIFKVMQSIPDCSTLFSVSTWSDKLGLSNRQLSRVINQSVGISAKQFLQLVRLQHSCQTMFKRQQSSLFAALHHGFYDQAHFLNNARHFLPASPMRYLQQFC